MTLRKAATLAAQLPQGARVYIETGVDSAWTDTEHLLAELIDVEMAAVWQRTGDKNARKPKPFPRPAEAAAQRDREEKVSRQAAMFREREQRRAELRRTTSAPDQHD